MAQVIAVNGLKRSGKNTVGNILADFLPGNVKQIGFADKLKCLGARALGYEGSDAELLTLMDSLKDEAAVIQVEDDAAHATNCRSFLQNLGSDARDILGKDLWVDQVLPPLRPMSFREHFDWQVNDVLGSRYPGVDFVVITDLRFENEAKRVKQYGGVLFEVVRPGLESDGHVSEMRLPEHIIDFKIDNNGTIADLRGAVQVALNTVGIRT